MTLLFFYKQQPYPPHPYEQRENVRKKRRKTQAKKPRIERIEQEDPPSVQVLPQPETMQKAAAGRGLDIRRYPEFKAKDWDKILRDAMLFEQQQTKLRDEKEIVELLTILDMEMSL